jgi:F-type H+-transporting ATPase subunit gamma
MEELMTDLVRRTDPESHPLFLSRAGMKHALLVMTSDKGLCGAFNTNIIREAMRYIRRHGTENVKLFVVGRKGCDYFRRIGIPAVKEYVNIFNTLGFVHAEIIVRDLLDHFQNVEIGAIELLYSEFKSIIQQRVVTKPFLPLVPVTSAATSSIAGDYLYEPAKDVLLDALANRFLKAQIYRVLLESNASELGAKMTSMDNATRNAKELIGAFTLLLNRTRQASITKEILEVVSGAEALK